MTGLLEILLLGTQQRDIIHGLHMVNLVRGHPCPRQKNSNRGRPPVHSKDKLDFICILMVA